MDKKKARLLINLSSFLSIYSTTRELTSHIRALVGFNPVNYYDVNDRLCILEEQIQTFEAGQA